MKVIQIDDKLQLIDLLLLADESRKMINRYLDRGIMFAIEDNGIKAECVVTDESDGILEIKNLAVDPKFHHCGYGKSLIEFLSENFSDRYQILQAGTGENLIPFYEKCGFKISHRIENFFIDNYDHSIFESGIQLIDMIILRRNL